MDYIIGGQSRAGNSLIVESTFNPQYDNAKFRKWHQKYGVRYAQVYCYADAAIIRKRFKDRAASDTRHVSSVEGEEGLRNLENHIQRGVEPLDIGGTLIKIDSTDFGKINEAAVAAQLRAILRSA